MRRLRWTQIEVCGQRGFERGESADVSETDEGNGKKGDDDDEELHGLIEDGRRKAGKEDVDEDHC